MTLFWLFACDPFGPPTVQVSRECEGISESHSVITTPGHEDSSYRRLAGAEAYEAIALHHQRRGETTKALICAKAGIAELGFSLDIDDRGIKPKRDPVEPTAQEALDKLKHQIWNYRHVFLDEPY